MRHKARTTKTAGTEPPVPAGDELKEWIRARAYELYEQGGREQGHDMENWLQAEQEFAARQTHKRAGS